MARFDIQADELDKYAKHLDGVAGEGARSFVPIAVTYRDRTRETAKELVRKDTWELHDSIKNTPGEASRMGLNATWEVTAAHASPIEYGFRHWISGAFIGPFPYVRPALDRHRRGFVEALASAAKERGLTKGRVRAGAGSI